MRRASAPDCQRPSRTRETPFRARVAAAVLALAGFQAGCAVGYAGARTAAGPRGQPRQIPAAPFILVMNDEVGSSLERALRTGAGVPNVRRASVVPALGTERGFVVCVEETDDWPAWSKVSTIASFVTFAAVPGVYVGEKRLAFGVTAPGGQTQRFHYRYREWMFSWAPLLLFGPNVVADFHGGMEPGEPKRRALDAIAAMFLEDATPFLAAHATEVIP